jgi:hypothetical protein
VRALVAILAMLAACAGAKSKPAPVPSPDPEVVAAPPAPAPAPASEPVIVADAKPPAPTPAPPPAKPSAAGADFTEQARWLYHVAGCGEGPLPEELAKDKKYQTIIDKHCKALAPHVAKFRDVYFVKGRKWLDEHVPANVPTTVVYPFGGGDLVSVLVAFPDAHDVTTISLELAGDPRRLRKLSPDQLQASLGALRVEIGGLLQVGSNTSKNLSSGQRNELPGQVSSFMMALVTHGFEPVSMRYFTLADDGAIKYLEQADIDALETKRTKALKGDWASPNFSEAFAHVEIQFRRPGETALRVHRHLGWNLGDEYLAKNPQLIRYLETKGKVTVLTKGGSYLLQRSNFSLIRDYMLTHLAWMLSDSTGPAPTYAGPAGMVQETYGSYAGAFLEGGRGNRHDQSFIELWRKNPRKKMGFRFGYVDVAGSGHVVVTRPK